MEVVFPSAEAEIVGTRRPFAVEEEIGVDEINAFPLHFDSRRSRLEPVGGGGGPLGVGPIFDDDRLGHGIVGCVSENGSRLVDLTLQLDNDIANVHVNLRF